MRCPPNRLRVRAGRSRQTLAGTSSYRPPGISGPASSMQSARIVVVNISTVNKIPHWQSHEAHEPFGLEIAIEALNGVPGGLARRFGREVPRASSASHG